MSGAGAAMRDVRLVEFVVPLPTELPTPNRMRGLHWSRAKRLRDNVHGFVWPHVHVAMHTHNIPRAARTDEPRLLELALVRGEGQRLLDADGAVAALKPVIDTMVAQGLLFDDSPKYVKLVFRDQERGPSAAARAWIGWVQQAAKG